MLRVAAVQDAPVFCDKAATTASVVEWIWRARDAGVQVLAFGETFLPGYPFWLSLTGGARFDDPEQKEAYRVYCEAAVTLDGPELVTIAEAARAARLFVVLGVAERGVGVASGSVYCTLVPIHPDRGILTPHRKLQPTYEERLVWAAGDGHGLEAHSFEGVTISGLNCWENWMPLARYAVYAAGAELHVALWPGSVRNTIDCTRFLALEGRVFVLSAGAVLGPDDVSPAFPLKATPGAHGLFHDGGSAIAAPDGRFLVEPGSGRRGLVSADLDLREVLRERQNFDPTGHYARPDVFQLEVNRSRQRPIRFRDDAPPESEP